MADPVLFMAFEPCDLTKSRALMTDAEFWESVAISILGDPRDEFEGYDWNPSDPEDDLAIATPCSECGATGACGWGVLGRPMIHARGNDD